MPLSIPNVLDVQESSGPKIPVVFDSPHSGSIYPSDFAFIAPRDAMTGSEDRFVDELYAVAPECGATLLRALFPRAYIDPNRSLADLDVSLLDGHWPHKVQASEKVGIGLGLICKYAEADVPIYGRKLSVAEVKRRIEHYYLPYHRALAELLDARHARFGQVWHLNCHSMWPQGTALSTDPGSPRPDVALGDQDGATCSPEFRSLVHDLFRDMGYEVKVNSPFKGMELVRAFSSPGQGRHSLQIEVNQRLYLDEKTHERSNGFNNLKKDLTKLIKAVCNYAAEIVEVPK